MANINETPLDRYLRKTGKIGDGNLSSKLSTTPIKKTTNKGGLLGGIGYTFEQLGLGVVRGVEGLSDFLVGGVADIFGADDFADEIMKSDWINYEHAYEWYNPNKATTSQIFPFRFENERSYYDQRKLRHSARRNPGDPLHHP
jgi:hypothetical protein